MSQDQRYEYKAINLNVLDFDDDGEPVLNEVAKDGWQLKEKVDMNGNTVYFVFERPVQ
jgi:hypothetical protein